MSRCIKHTPHRGHEKKVKCTLHNENILKYATTINSYVKCKLSYLPLHNQSDCEGDFGVFFVESGGFLQIHAGGGVRSVSRNFDCVWGYVWAGDTPLNLMAGTRGLLALTAGRVSWKTGAHLIRKVHRFRALEVRGMGSTRRLKRSYSL